MVVGMKDREDCDEDGGICVTCAVEYATCDIGKRCRICGERIMPFGGWNSW